MAAASNYNQTVLYTNLSMFMCPSDPNVGQRQNNNSYAASYGATTSNCYNWTSNAGVNWVSQETAAESSGIFTIGKSYGVQSITDGSSNTVAYSEALVGDSNGSEFAGNTTNPSRYRGNYITGPCDDCRRHREDVRHVEREPEADLQFAGRMRRRVSNLADRNPGRPGLPLVHGDALAGRCSTRSRFPTTRSTRYGGCRDGGTPGQFPNDGFSYGASSAHPGGANVLFGDGSVQVHQEHHQLPDLVGPGDQERRRSYQRRCLLMMTRPIVGRRAEPRAGNRQLRQAVTTPEAITAGVVCSLRDSGVHVRRRWWIIAIGLLAACGGFWAFDSGGCGPTGSRRSATSPREGPPRPCRGWPGWPALAS